MSNDEINIEDEKSDDVVSDDPLTDDLFDDDAVDEEVLLDDDVTDDVLLEDDVDDEEIPAKTGATTDDDSDTDGDTEALDDLEAEELEMLTEDEASETIVVDEATQLRDIRRAQISIEASSVGGATDGEFVCSSCFLVKKASQLASRRKKICLDCAD